MGTQFSKVYNRFLNKITDDMYLELTPQDTLKDIQQLLIQAIPNFEFPRKNLYDYSLKTEEVNSTELTEDDFVISIEEFDAANGQKYSLALIDKSAFDAELTPEEENILAILMRIGWLQRQITSIENTRMKYSGSDFKFTSQANHLSKLLSLLNECNRESLHMQRLYKRRKIINSGEYRSNWSVLRENTAINNQPYVYDDEV